MAKPLVSVIIPCYNAESFLPRIFKCFDRQTYKNLQAIFVDDGSTDATLSLIREYCSTRNHVYVTGENRGSASARNMGLNLIEGELFAFCDADDIITDDHFELLVRHITTSDADMAVCGIKRVDGKRADKTPLCAKKRRNSMLIFDRTQALTQYFSQELFDFPLYNKIYRTSLLKKSGARFFENSRYGEESYFIYKYLSFADKTVYYGAKTYVYLQHGTSLMHGGFKISRLDVYKNLDAVMTEIKNDKNLSVAPYVSVMRAGYSVGILHFILHSDFKDGEVIAKIVGMLKRDVKSLKKTKKVAFYKKALLPACALIAGIVYGKYVKKYPTFAAKKPRGAKKDDAADQNDFYFINN